MEELKLFVWEEFEPDATDGLAVAIAATEEEARGIIQEIHGINPKVWGKMKVFPVTEKRAFAVIGASAP